MFFLLLSNTSAYNRVTTVVLISITLNYFWLSMSIFYVKNCPNVSQFFCIEKYHFRRYFSIPSPPVKIQIMGGKFAWGVKAKHCWVLSTNFWKKIQCFAVLSQVNFPTNNLNSHWSWRWLDWIQAINWNLF